MNTHTFDQLLERYQRGNCTPVERALLDHWLESLDNQHDAFAEIAPPQQSQIKARMRLAIQTRIAEEAEAAPRLPAVAQPVPARRGWLSYGLRIAASVLLVLGLGLGYWMWQRGGRSGGPTPTPLAQVAPGPVQKLLLPDGSLVWLKGRRSHLHYPLRFKGAQREVALEGEALFEVAKDAAHPFVIRCGTLVTRVVGTSFNIRNEGAQTEVAVLTGRVTLLASGTHRQLVLVPAQKAIYSERSQTLVALPDRTPGAYARGTEYALSFDDVRLGFVLRQLEMKFDVRIRTEDETLRNCLITADFTDQSLAKSLDLITQALTGVTYRREGKTVVLMGQGCD